MHSKGLQTIYVKLNCVDVIFSLPRDVNGNIDYRYMPVLANGHIGVTVFDDHMYLNGLYSGKGGKMDKIYFLISYNGTIFDCYLFCPCSSTK